MEKQLCGPLLVLERDPIDDPGGAERGGDPTAAAPIPASDRVKARHVAKDTRATFRMLRSRRDDLVHGA
jgi:hypothetical protein